MRRNDRARHFQTLELGMTSGLVNLASVFLLQPADDFCAVHGRIMHKNTRQRIERFDIIRHCRVAATGR
jgi:hypothetical protein